MCFSRIRPDHPRSRSATWICMCGHTRDSIIYFKFYRNPFRGFGAPGGQNMAFPITLASRFYDSLYYRTSRDELESLQYGDFWIFQYGGRRHRGFYNFQIINGWNVQESQIASMCQISLKSLQPQPR